MHDLLFQIGTSCLRLRLGDISREESDVIVNAANSGLLGGGGVDGAIHRAGGPQILAECKAIRAAQGPCAPGKAVITSGGKLAARWVVHTVGPIWRGGTANEALTLASAYRCSLERAQELRAKNVSFPSISTGAYGYPLKEAANVALSTLRDFLQENPAAFAEVRFVLFDHAAFAAFEETARKVFSEDSG